MPSIAHEAPLELLRSDPQLAVILLQALGVGTPPGATARMVPADLTIPVPAELRADGVILLEGDRGKLAVIIEVQLQWDEDKKLTWPAYLTQVRLVHRCDAVLLVICPDPATARSCRAVIGTGHPGFDLAPLVIDATTTPLPGEPGGAASGPELIVLAVLTGALDLETDATRRMVLASLAAADVERRKSYTVFVLNAVSAAARQALEELMTTTEFSHPFFDRIEAKALAEGLAKGQAKGLAEGQAKGLAEGQAKGRAEGEARMILRVLAARGLQVPGDVQERVLACTDIAQLEVWGDRAATAASVADVFGA